MDVKTVLENANAIKEIADSMKNLDLKEKIVDLTAQIIELREENANLKQELDKKKKFNMKFENNMYWNVDKNGEKEGPFCPACWDNNIKPIRMLDMKNHYRCPICKIAPYK